MSKTSRKVALYLRSAAFNQKSIENQRRELGRFCARQDWAIVETYEDNGYSGLTTNRPGLKHMLRAATKGEFEAFVVRDLSRLTRAYPDLLYIVHFLDRYRVGSRGTPLAIDTTMCYGRCVMACLGAFDRDTLRTTRVRRSASRRTGTDRPRSSPSP